MIEVILLIDFLGNHRGKTIFLDDANAYKLSKEKVVIIKKDIDTSIYYNKMLLNYAKKNK